MTCFINKISETIRGADSRNLGETSDTESAEVRPKDSKHFPINLTSFFKKTPKDREGDAAEEPEEPETPDEIKVPLDNATGGAGEPAEGLVYAELDLVSPNMKAMVKSEDDKTEYAEIVYTPNETEKKST